MIKISDLTKKDIQRGVIYTDGTGEIQQGYITSWNKKFIFVDYGKSCGHGVATTPRDLKFLSG